MSWNITITDILALVAIFVSIITWAVTAYKERKRAEKDHGMTIFGDIYKEYLVKRFPMARSKLHISEVGVLTGTDDLIECLNSMRKDFLYFQYADTPFFDGLKDKLQGLEDYLILAEEHPLAEEKAMNFLHHVDSSLSHIYEDVVAHF